MSAFPTYQTNGVTVKVADGLAALVPHFDGFLLDLWGCLHDGLLPYAGVIPALQRLKAMGKRLVLLSNAPRRAEVLSTGMARIGILPDYYDHLMSSGELAWRAIAEGREDWLRGRGRRCLWIGPPRDHSMVEGNGVSRVDTVAAADFLLVTGPREDGLDVGDHEEVLAQALERRLPLVCANPDLSVMRGAERLVCAGALARYYEERGGLAIYYGKPFAATYEVCRRLLAVGDESRVLAVGDTLHTDVAGAQAAGLATALIPGGIHGDGLGIAMGELPAPEPLAALCAAMGHVPDYLLARFAW